MPVCDRGAITLAMLEKRQTPCQPTPAVADRPAPVKTSSGQKRRTLRKAKAAVHKQGACPHAPLTPSERFVLQQIVDAVTHVHGISAHDFYHGGRWKRFNRARHAFALLARVRTTQSYPRLGRFLGRDHSTVINNARKGCDLLKTDPDFAAKYAEAEAILEGERS